MNVDTVGFDAVILSQNHRAWLQDTITKTGAKRLEQHENNLATAIANSALSKDLSAEYVRLLAAQLSTVKAIRTLLYDTETFVEKCGNR